MVITKMIMRAIYIYGLLLVGTLLGACSKEEPTLPNDEAKGKQLSASIALDFTIDSELPPIVDLDDNFRADIRLNRESDKISARFSEFGAGKTIPALLLVSGPYGLFTLNIDAKVTEAKRLKISVSPKTFNTIHNNPSFPWKGRIYLGGKYNPGDHTLSYTDHKGFFYDLAQHYSQPYPNFGPLAGKIPFVSEEFEMSYDEKADILTAKNRSTPIAIKPRGFFINLKIRNPRAIVTSETMNFSWLQFESNELASRGFLNLRRYNGQYFWTSSDYQNTQTIRQDWADGVPLSVAAQDEKHVFLWVDRHDRASFSTSTKVSCGWYQGHIRGEAELLNKTTPIIPADPRGRVFSVYLTLPD